MTADYSHSDIVFINGRVLTVNENDDIVSAVAVKADRIMCVGSDEEVLMTAGRDTAVIDLKGRTLMPGINDSHYHPILNGMISPQPDAAILDIGYARAKSLTEIFELVKEAGKCRKKGEWISAMGYEATLLSEHRHPTLSELDEVWPDGPLQLITCNGHNAVYNSKALSYLGIERAEDAAKYNDGDVCVEDGKLTGELRGHTHFRLWGMVDYSEENQKKAALKSLEQCLSHGITSIGDMGECGKVSYHLMQKMCRSGEFPVRVYMAIHSIFGRQYSAQQNELWMNLGFTTGLGDEHFRVGPCKFMIDGGSGEPTCFTREPYSHDPDMKYEKGWDLEETVQYIKKINDSECQCTAHAMGDGAIEYMVKGYEEAYAKCADKEAFKSRRHRIEHCMLVDQDLIDRMAVMNICPSVNAGLQIRNGKNLARFYGPEREKYLGALKSMMDAGIKCSIHSDAPSGPVGFEMIAGAVNRYDIRHGYQCAVDQAVSLMDAIRCCTVNAAYQSYEEDIKGSVECGKLADLIVLDRDITETPKTSLQDVKVDMTMIGGKILYESEN